MTDLTHYKTMITAKNAVAQAVAACGEDTSWEVIEIKGLKRSENNVSYYVGYLQIDESVLNSDDWAKLQGFTVVDQAMDPVSVSDQPTPVELQQQLDAEQSKESEPEKKEAEVPGATVEVQVTVLPPAVAKGADTTKLTKQQVRANKYSFLAEQGLISQEQADAVKATASVAKPGVRLSTGDRYTYIGPKGDGTGNHRVKPTGDGYRMIEWLKEHPGSTQADLKDAGWPPVHIRWDLVRFPQFIKVDSGKAPATPAPAPEPIPEVVAPAPKAVKPKKGSNKSPGGEQATA
jgi:hypothetical protein